jgi:3-oxoacyl-[acyl-carrier protein] reductase
MEYIYINNGDDYMFNNKIVLVTGSSRGIGRAIAYAFALSGATVILNASSNKETLINTYNDFIEQGFHCHYIQADVSNYEQVSNMICEIYSYYGKIDVLVNNAGISHIGLLSDMSLAQWHSIMNTNVDSVFNCCKNVIPKMVQLKEGNIINISSMW